MPNGQKEREIDTKKRTESKFTERENVQLDRWKEKYLKFAIKGMHPKNLAIVTASDAAVAA